MNVKTETDNGVGQQHHHSLEDLLMSDLWMCGITPPPAIVPLIRVSSSSSPRIASCKCLGVIRFTFRSLLAFPASSNTSAVRYSKIAAEYTAAVAPTLPFAVVRSFSNRKKPRFPREKNNDYLETGARGARDGFLLILILVFVGRSGGCFAHNQTLGAFSRHFSPEIGGIGEMEMARTGRSCLD
nr:3-ketoacyl-CoA synthase 1 [Ipomoea batatas]